MRINMETENTDTKKDNIKLWIGIAIGFAVGLLTGIISSQSDSVGDFVESFLSITASFLISLAPIVILWVIAIAAIIFLIRYIKKK